jgi:hypothetical protein
LGSCEDKPPVHRRMLSAVTPKRMRTVTFLRPHGVESHLRADLSTDCADFTDETQLTLVLLKTAAEAVLAVRGSGVFFGQLVFGTDDPPAEKDSRPFDQRRAIPT